MKFSTRHCFENIIINHRDFTEKFSTSKKAFFDNKSAVSHEEFINFALIDSMCKSHQTL